jgi:subtilisin family serine protease
MNRATVSRVVLAAALLLAPLAPVLIVDPAPSETEPVADGSRDVERVERLFGDDTEPSEPVDREVLVTVELRGKRSLSAERLDIERRYARQGIRHVEGYVPLSDVRSLSADPAVGSVRMRAAYDLGGQVAPGVERIGADTLHERDLTGENVTIGIIDGGFRVSHPELAGHVAAYRSFGPPGGTDHGTAVASVVADTAPGADLHVAAVGDDTSATEYRSAVTWLQDSGADVIVDAGSYFGNAGREELSTVARDASNETLFVTSAGNYAERHWQGIHEPNGRRWVPFQPGAEGNTLAGGDTFAGRVRASLQWEPANGTNATDDYRLYLFRQGVSGQRVVASATAAENASSLYLDAVVPRGRYYLAVEGDNVSTAHELELFATRDLTHRSRAGSLAVPASLPGVLAVGAYDHRADAVAGFSSRGPVGNRTGVGLVAPDAVAAPGTGATGGTSFAAPYVAGTAALLVEAHPNATVADLRTVLDRSARDVGPPGHDPAAGAGLVDARAAAATAEAHFAVTAATNTTDATNATSATNTTAAPPWDGTNATNATNTTTATGD